MHRRPTTHRLDELLREADPVDTSTLTGESLARTLDEVAGAIVSEPARAARDPRTRRLNRRRAFVLLAAALLLVGAGVATGALLGARTGSFPTKAEEAMGGPGEALNPAASDFRQVALEVASDIPYPAGYESWRDFLIADEIRTGAGSGLVSTGALHGWFAASAFCAWVHVWRQADLRGDPTARAEEMIAAAPSWKAVSDEDPHPDPTVTGDGGSTQYSLFGWMLPYRSAVLAGDRVRVEHLLATGYGDKCWTSDPAWRAELDVHPEWGSLSRSRMTAEYEKFLAGEGS